MTIEDFARIDIGQIEIISESIDVLRGNLEFSLWKDYGIKLKDPQEYTERAIDSLLRQVWYKGNSFSQLDELGDVTVTDFASWVDCFDMEYYIAAGTVENKNVKIYRYEGENLQESIHRAYSHIVRNHPMHVICENAKEMFDLDLLDKDIEIVVDTFCMTTPEHSMPSNFCDKKVNRKPWVLSPLMNACFFSILE